MRRFLVRAAVAGACTLALSGFGVNTPIVQTVLADSDDAVACPVSFQQLRSALRDADTADSTGLNNHYWAVVVNRAGVVCAVAFSGQGRDSQWLLSRDRKSTRLNSSHSSISYA